MKTEWICTDEKVLAVASASIRKCTGIKKLRKRFRERERGGDRERV